jgi:hypothetical protein
VGAVLGGALAAGFGITAPYWVGFVVAVIVSVVTWRTFDPRIVAEAYGRSPLSADGEIVATPAVG